MDVKIIKSDNPFIVVRNEIEFKDSKEMTSEFENLFKADKTYKIKEDNNFYTFKYKNSKDIAFEFENTQVAIWCIPYNQKHLKDLLKYDTDQTKWYEESNQDNINEIENAEKNLNISLSKYKVNTKTTIYEDLTSDITSTYPNGSTVKESQGKNHFFYTIKDKFGRIVAEKIFGTDSDEGRKYVHKYFKNGDNTLKVTYVYSYDINQDRATDVVNYGYYPNPVKFVKGAEFVKEYYTLNGQEVKAKRIDKNTYKVKDKNGKKITFKAE